MEGKGEGGRRRGREKEGEGGGEGGGREKEEGWWFEVLVLKQGENHGGRNPHAHTHEFSGKSHQAESLDLRARRGERRSLRRYRDAGYSLG